MQVVSEVDPSCHWWLSTLACLWDRDVGPTRAAGSALLAADPLDHSTASGAESQAASESGESCCHLFGFTDVYS